MSPSLKHVLIALAVIGGCVALGEYLGRRQSDGIAILVAAKGVQALPHKSVAVPDVAASPKALFEAEDWHLVEPNTAPLASTETFASRQVQARAALRQGTLPNLTTVRMGQAISLPVHGASAIGATITFVSTDAEGWTRVAGTLTGGGSFFLSQKGPSFFGRMVQPAVGRAYRIATEPEGTVIIEQKPLSSVACATLPRKQSAAAPAPDLAPALAAPASAAVPVLDSDPSLPNVIYIDFDGETVVDPDWNNGHTIFAVPPTIKGARLSAAQITDIWNRVAEDYRSFKIAITTDVNRYNAAGPRHRVRCIVTPTDTAEPGAGGVAWTDSYRMAGIDFSSTVPCWAFTADYYTTADISGIISHEVGHTMGLSHDGRANPYEEYFDGQGSGATSWAPIMGATYDHIVTQWSKGEYYRANNREDDIAIIGSAANGFGFVGDEDAAGGPVALPATGAINVAGIIGNKLDVDQYLFATSGGIVTVVAKPAAVEPNLDILLEIRDQSGATVLASSNPLGALDANLSTQLPLGTYRIVVRGTGEGNPQTVGYTSYGSMGAYTMTGAFIPMGVTLPVITSEPAPVGVFVGGKATFSVTATSEVPPTYQWQKNNTNLPGQTSSTLVISPVAATHAGSYRCIVSNIAGIAPSDPATLSILTKPAITKNPLAASVSAGGAAPLTMVVTASGTEPLHYQWQHGTVDVPGQTAATLSIASPQWSDGGSYRCVVTNDYGTATSAAVAATILSPPLIMTPPPAAKDVPKRGASSLSFVAAGSPPLAYQWYHGTVKITGAVSPLLKFSGITDATAGSYHCVVTNRYGSITTNDSVITVRTPPAITLQPLAKTIHEGDAFVLTVAASGSDTLSYQWQRDGINVGAGPTFSVASATWYDHGAYRCLVSNSVGTVASTAVAVVVHAGPIIVTPPQGGLIAIGAKSTLKVVAIGSPTLKYQWRKAGVNIPGAVAASLVITGLNDTTYDVLASNPYNLAGTPSAVAAITAMAPVKITQQPLAKSATVGSIADFTVSATGDGAVSYQWKKNGVALSGQTAAALHLGPLAATDGASYSVTVTNPVSAATSVAAKLTVVAAPKLIQRPVATTAKARTPLVLTALATGSGTLSYHWQKDNADIIGATGSTFTISSAVAADAGSYRVVVSNAADTIYSDPVPVKVLAPEPAEIRSFNPTHGPVGSFIRVFGSGFEGTTKVTMRAEDGSTVDAPFVIVSNEEVLVTVPKNAATSKLTIGDALSAFAFVVTPGPANTTTFDAQIISGTGGRVAAKTLAPVAWYAWKPTISGDFTIHVSPAEVSFTIYANQADGDMIEVSPTRVTAGTLYFIEVKGEAAGIDYVLRVEPKTTEDQIALVTTGWMQIQSPHGISMRFQIPSTASTSWLLCNAVRQPLFGLEAKAGALSVYGQAYGTGQTLVVGEDYRLEFALDSSTQTWGALLNGEWIVRDQRITAGAIIGGLQVTARGGIRIDEFKVTKD